MRLVMLNPGERCYPGDVMLNYKEWGIPRFLPRDPGASGGFVDKNRVWFSFRIYGVMRRWRFVFHAALEKQWRDYTVVAETYLQAMASLRRAYPGAWDVNCHCVDYPKIDHFGSNLDKKEARCASRHGES